MVGRAEVTLRHVVLNVVTDDKLLGLPTNVILLEHEICTVISRYIRMCPYPITIYADTVKFLDLCNS